MKLPGLSPRLLALPPGADFPALLAQGLRDRMAGQPPEAMAGVTLIVNTQRMRRRVGQALATGAGVLPRMRLLTEFGDDPLLGGAGETVAPLARQLELAVLVGRLLDASPGLAPRAALFDLAGSLGTLMTEMRDEGVGPGALAALDLSGHSAHWARTRAFLDVVARWFDPEAAPDAATRRRAATEALVAGWQALPPRGPVILAGSTGSRGTTALLARAVARLPLGAVVLPGFDRDLPQAVWDRLAQDGAAEDHPQYRFARLLGDLGLRADQVADWVPGVAAPDGARNRLISLSLRPAPVTDQWITQGPALGDLGVATQGMTLIEAPSPRAEAVAVALVLRQAVQDGRAVALITPDRGLTRRVVAALDRWGIRPDDAAGEPLAQSPPGRLLRLVAQAMGRALAADEVLALLKHPLVQAGAGRLAHLRLTRALELRLRDRGPAFPDGAALRAAAEDADWGARIGALLDALAGVTGGPMPDLVARHRALAEDLAAGALWQREAGEDARAAMDEIARDAAGGLMLTPRDYAALFDGVLEGREVRRTHQVDSRVLILGPQEARIEAAPLTVLAGLTEGTWPARPGPDPWLNRALRAQAGLLLPERQVGLAAHDYQMAVAAPQVVLSRAHRDAEAETVPSRWLNRLTNLLDGLPDQGGPTALAAMRARGADWLRLAESAEPPIPAARARRPSPQPPVHLRPKRLALTAIERLIRDPYAIYAAHILRLRALKPLRPLADARLRGEVLHRVPEAFLKDPDRPTGAEAAAYLLDIARGVLARDVAWPSLRAAWAQRVAGIAPAFVASLGVDDGVPVWLEMQGEAVFPEVGFTLVGRPDRIDAFPDGSLRLVDYKTGEPPKEAQQATFQKQLLLAAVMAGRGGFRELGPREVREIVYLGLKKGLPDVTTPLDAAKVAEHDAGLVALVSAWGQRGRGYSARRAMFQTRDVSDYDGLSRFGEWAVSEDPWPEEVG